LRELEATFAAGHSVLAYQHFAREKRQPYITRQCGRLAAATGAETTFAVQSAHVAFLLAAQPPHLTPVSEALSVVSERWGNRLEVHRF
jgi:hypothetical protein